MLAALADEHTVCKICGAGYTDEKDPVLLCDTEGCNAGATLLPLLRFDRNSILVDFLRRSEYHMRCLNLGDIPEGQWFCPPCVVVR